MVHKLLIMIQILKLYQKKNYQELERLLHKSKLIHLKKVDIIFCQIIFIHFVSYFIIFTPEFEQTHYPDSCLRENLSKALNLAEMRIQV